MHRSGEDKIYTDSLYRLFNEVVESLGPMGDWLEKTRMMELFYKGITSVFDERFFDLYDYPNAWMPQFYESWLEELDWFNAIIWDSFPNLFYEFLQNNPNHTIHKRMNSIRKIRDEDIAD